MAGFGEVYSECYSQRMKFRLGLPVEPLVSSHDPNHPNRPNHVNASDGDGELAIKWREWLNNPCIDYHRASRFSFSLSLSL